MPKNLKPVPDGTTRAAIAKQVRDTATDYSNSRAIQPTQSNNGDAAKAQGGAEDMTSAVGTFTKGLTHDAHGRVKRADLEDFIEALNQPHSTSGPVSHSPFPGVYKSGKPAVFDAQLHDPKVAPYNHPVEKGVRGWESPISGHTFDLMGTDADGTGMPEAPKVGSAELSAEMAEVYCAALMRDEPFITWDAEGPEVKPHVEALKKLPFFASETGLDDQAKKRRAARLINGPISGATLFRGSTPGAMKGPYISQFMLVGNAERGNPSPDDGAQESIGAQNRAQSFGFRESVLGEGALKAEDGVILYGVQGIPQVFKGHAEKIDHMTSWSAWHDVQNGADLKNVADYFQDHPRFIHTPRDLATYVHFDALYQAYLNAVLILSGMGADTDIGLPEGGNTTQPERDAFATFGGPHILSLVTEVATRALKAVRRQKFNIHLRSRPEMIAAGISLAWKGGTAADTLGPFKADCEGMRDALMPILTEVATHNGDQNGKGHVPAGASLEPIDEASNALLPMAFPEGSPMHAAYGAGHATVAGACVTIVKAFFEMYEIDVKRGQDSIYDVVAKEGDTVKGYPGKYPAHLFQGQRLLTETGQTSKKKFKYNPLDSAFVPSNDGKKLEPWTKENLSIQGELDKLAANISIGRNFAGVHYYTDYYESLRMGERIAVSILQEQMLTYREPVSMRFTSFDGDHIMIAGTGGSRGDNDALVFVWKGDGPKKGEGGTRQDFEDWWNRHR